MPENEVQYSDIEGTMVAFGHRSMPYGPFDPKTHEPSGYYDMYVAEFEQDEIEYQIVAKQMEIEEFVKVVSSIIFGGEMKVGKRDVYNISNVSLAKNPHVSGANFTKCSQDI